MKLTVEEKSFAFAVRIVKLCKYLRENKQEFELSKQLIRSGTSIGANLSESQQAQSRSDFIHKLSIALKEASETNYWLRILRASDYLTDSEFQSVIADCVELEKMLTAIIKTTKATSTDIQK